MISEKAVEAAAKAIRGQFEQSYPSLISTMNPRLDIALARAALEAVHALHDGEQWRHKKRGSVVTEVARGHAQASVEPIWEMQPVVIYTHDGAWWVRSVAEFEDGRFERVIIAEDHQS